MLCKGGFYIPKHVLVHASGIDEKIINSDIKDGKLQTNQQGFIWYHNAINYVSRKWKEGDTLMYPPIADADDILTCFSTRLLSIIDDEVAVGNLQADWRKGK